MIKIASFGCGVDSVAGLLLSRDQGIEYDEIIFADTNEAERPETYAYLEYFEKKSGFKITKVKSHLGKIYDYYFNKKVQPTKFRRDCTGKFKISPIRKYLREKYGKKERFEMNIYIDYTEAHRMRTKPDVKYIDNKYPLVEQRLGREDLKKYITSKGYELPIKSGCYFCPFTTKKGWIDLRNKHPSLWSKSLALEKNSTLRLPLINLKGKESQNLMECSCFNG